MILHDYDYEIYASLREEAQDKLKITYVADRYGNYIPDLEKMTPGQEEWLLRKVEEARKMKGKIGSLPAYLSIPERIWHYTFWIICGAVLFFSPTPIACC